MSGQFFSHIPTVDFSSPVCRETAIAVTLNRTRQHCLPPRMAFEAKFIVLQALVGALDALQKQVSDLKLKIVFERTDEEPVQKAFSIPNENTA